ncbi:MAG TPA: phytase [Chitinispirillaceae bacterium]|nr:phytase [Chitinispirillaceae bacterium]
MEGDICEGICSDDELGYIYICDENVQILKYHADPDKNINTLVSRFALDDGIKSDREGINIYRCDNNSGYILMSSQGNDQIKVYDRITNEFLGTVIAQGMKDCDGLDVTAVPLGPQFPHGLAAFHLGSSMGSQFGFYDWADIAMGLGLAKPCDAKRPVTIMKARIARKSGELRKPEKNISEGNCKYHHIHLQNLKVQNCTADITILNIQGRKSRFQYTAAIHNGELAIPLTLSEFHPGLYIVNCVVKGVFSCNIPLIM